MSLSTLLLLVVTSMTAHAGSTPTPASARGQLQQAKQLERTGHSEQAQQIYAAIVDHGATAPGYGRALPRLVRASQRMGNRSVLIDALNTGHLADLNRDQRSWAALVLGTAAFNDGRARDAGSLLAQVDPTHELRPYALTLLGELAWSGDRDTALRHYRNVVRAQATSDIPGLTPLSALQDQARTYLSSQDDLGAVASADPR